MTVYALDLMIIGFWLCLGWNLARALLYLIEQLILDPFVCGALMRVKRRLAGSIGGSTKAAARPGQWAGGYQPTGTGRHPGRPPRNP